MATKSQASLVLRKSVRPHHTVNIYTPHLAMRFESPPSPPTPPRVWMGNAVFPLGGLGDCVMIIGMAGVGVGVGVGVGGGGG